MPFQPQQVANYIGNGLTFPFELQNGRGVIKSGYDLIRSSIRSILSFEIGRRFYLGEFGSRLNDMLEEPNDEVVHNMINVFVVDAITTWEKRIQSISTTIESIDYDKIQVRLVYRVVNAQNSDSFIYPFYKQIIH